MKTQTSNHPMWQNAIRESAAKYSTPTWGRKDIQPEELAEENKQRTAGKDLHMILTKVMGVPVAMPILYSNCYIVDGFMFSLKIDADGNEDRQPVMSSTATLTGGHRIDKSRSSIGFTLYVQKVVADPAFDGWPGRKVIVERNYKLHMSNPHFVRNQLAEAIDALDAEYQSVLPRYQAWKLLEKSTPEELQDFVLQTLRQAAKRMPALEILPTRIPSADEADDATALDGMLPKLPPKPSTPDDDEPEPTEDEAFDDEAWDEDEEDMDYGDGENPWDEDTHEYEPDEEDEPAAV